MKLNNEVKVFLRTKEEVEGDFSLSTIIKKNIEQLYGQEVTIENIKDDTFSIKSKDGNLITNENKEPIFLNFKLFEFVYKNDFKLNIGDYVTIREDLIVGERCGSLIFAEKMKETLKKSYKIREIDYSDNTFRIFDEEYGEWWYSYKAILTLETRNRAEFKVEKGVFVKIREDLMSGESYSNINFVGEMECFRGKKALIVGEKRTGVYYLNIDNKRYVWVKEMFEFTYGKVKDIISIQQFFDENLAIKCNTQEDLERFLKFIKDKYISWASGRSICIDECDIEKRNCFSLDLNDDGEVSLFFCDEGWYRNNGFKCCNYNETLLEAPRYFDKIDLNAFNTTKKRVKRTSLIRRGLKMGDIYFLKHPDFEEHTGWRVAMSGYSVGISTKNNKSWSSLKEDEDLEITKIIPYDKKIQCFSKVSEFINTKNEELIKDILIEVV